MLLEPILNTDVPSSEESVHCFLLRTCNGNKGPLMKKNNLKRVCQKRVLKMWFLTHNLNLKLSDRRLRRVDRLYLSVTLVAPFWGQGPWVHGLWSVAAPWLCGKLMGERWLRDWSSALWRSAEVLSSNGWKRAEITELSRESLKRVRNPRLLWRRLSLPFCGRLSTQSAKGVFGQNFSWCAESSVHGWHWVELPLIDQRNVCCMCTRRYWAASERRPVINCRLFFTLSSHRFVWGYCP